VGWSVESHGGEEFAGDETRARLIIYETGDTRSAVGTATVVSVNAKDPKKPVVKIKAGKALIKVVSLEEIKKEKFSGSRCWSGLGDCRWCR
jgi:hypothetical protein